MNNVQLMALASTKTALKKHFKGVYAIDTLPSHQSFRRPASFICNLDRSQRAGTHWVAFYFPRTGDPEFFDSYGRVPNKECEHFIRSQTYVYNCKFLQSPLSAVCGQYCLYNIWQRSLDRSMDESLQIFHEHDQLYNDNLVNTLIEIHFDVDLNVFDIPWQLKQMSVPLQLL